MISGTQIVSNDSFSSVCVCVCVCVFYFFIYILQYPSILIILLEEEKTG